MFTGKLVVVLTGTPAWIDQAEALVVQHDFDVRRWDSIDGNAQARYLTMLIDTWAALVIVDGDHPDWKQWVVVSKRHQATRRVPVLVVTQNDDVAQRADVTGADGVLATPDVESGLLDRVRVLARRIDSALAETLDCECKEALPPMAQLGVKRFNAGAYYAQHDAFEEQWMEESGPVRELYRAVLQVGVAYHHLTHGNYRGAVKMLRRSVQWFAQLPDECQGINVRQLREDAAQVRTVLEAMNPDDIESFDRSLLKPVPMVAQD